MAYVNPLVPNLADFATFAYAQGVPVADLPNGILTTVTLSTAGNLTAASASGTVAVGMVLYGTGITANTYLATWNSGSNTGTVTPIPTTAVSVASASTYSPYLAWALEFAVNVCLEWNSYVSAALYVQAVYNLAFHHLLMLAQDVEGLVLTSMTWASGVVTATASAALPFAVGQPFSVTIVGANPFGYNGTYTALQSGTNTFQFELVSNPGTMISPGTFGYGFFAQARQQFNMLSLTAGVVSGATDQGTSDTLVVPDFFKNITMDDLNLLLTPWGRYYQGWCQAYGPNIVGLT